MGLTPRRSAAIGDDLVGRSIDDGSTGEKSTSRNVRGIHDPGNIHDREGKQDERRARPRSHAPHLRASRACAFCASSSPCLARSAAALRAREKPAIIGVPCVGFRNGCRTPFRTQTTRRRPLMVSHVDRPAVQPGSAVPVAQRAPGGGVMAARHPRDSNDRRFPRSFSKVSRTYVYRYIGGTVRDVPSLCVASPRDSNEENDLHPDKYLNK